MARTRNIKPGFFKNDELAECSPLARILFAGLWTLADREGRGDYRPRIIKVEVLPYDECNVDALASELVDRGFVIIYEADGRNYFELPTFGKHQNPHKNEESRKLPSSTGAVRCQYESDHGFISTALASLLPPSSNHLVPSTLLGGDETGTEPPEDSELHEDSPVVETFPCDGKPDRFDVRQSLIDEFSELYPKLDVPSEVRESRAWILASPSRRKTAGGMRRFLTGWLSKSNNRFRGTGPPGANGRGGVDPSSFPSDP